MNKTGMKSLSKNMRAVIIPILLATFAGSGCGCSARPPTIRHASLAGTGPLAGYHQTQWYVPVTAQPTYSPALDRPAARSAIEQLPLERLPPIHGWQ